MTSKPCIVLGAPVQEGAGRPGGGVGARGSGGAGRRGEEEPMAAEPCIVVGAPVQEGAGRLGCDMGPSAFRTAGLLTELRNPGYTVEDRRNNAPAQTRRGARE